jgi:hypothetical protein
MPSRCSTDDALEDAVAGRPAAYAAPVIPHIAAATASAETRTFNGLDASINRLLFLGSERGRGSTMQPK